MVPILVCLIVNLSTGHALDWFYVVLAGLAVCASLVLVPLTVPRDKLFWTFCAFTLSVLLLMAVCNYYTHGNWFFLAALRYVIPANFQLIEKSDEEITFTVVRKPDEEGEEEAAEAEN